jgi:hypothetical protein
MSAGTYAPSPPKAQVSHTHVNTQPPSYVLIKLWGTAEQLLSYTNGDLGACVALALEQHQIAEAKESIHDEEDIPY